MKNPYKNRFARPRGEGVEYWKYEPARQITSGWYIPSHNVLIYHGPGIGGESLFWWVKGEMFVSLVPQQYTWCEGMR